MDKNRNDLRLILINSTCSSPYCSYVKDGEITTFHADEFAAGKVAGSADKLPMALKKLSDKHSLSEADFIAVTTGPGSFTGIRVGISLAKGIATALEKKIIPVNNFDLMLHRCPDIPSKCVVLINSKADEYYYRFYKNTVELKSGFAAINEIIGSSEKGMKIVVDLDNETLIKHSYLELINLRNYENETKVFLKLAQNNTINAVKPELIEPVYIKDFIVRTNALV